ncbi:hypothetical protein L7F22_010754 [Adiantum nelumboides]|nr:hypothetical protein [Adiantum nelumboides]
MERALSFLDSKQDRDAAALTCRSWRSLLSGRLRTMVCVQLDLKDIRAPPAGTIPHYFRQSERRWSHAAEEVQQAMAAFPAATSLTIQGLNCDLSSSGRQLFPPMVATVGAVSLFPSLPSRLTSLSLRDVCLVNTRQWASHLAIDCPALTHLHLKLVDLNYIESAPSSRQMITDSHLAALAHGCRRLTSLTIYASMEAVTDTGLETLLRHSAALSHLSLCYIPYNYRWPSTLQGWGLRGACNSASLTSAPLTCLTLRFFKALTFDGLEEGFSSGLGATLRSLTLDGAKVDMQRKHSADQEIVKLIARHCSRRLESLRLCQINHYNYRDRNGGHLLNSAGAAAAGVDDDDGTQPRVMSFPALKSLYMRDFPHDLLSKSLSGSLLQWETLARGSPMLQHLHASHCFGREFRVPHLLACIATRCHSLRTLTLAHHDILHLPARKPLERFMMSHPNVQVRVQYTDPDSDFYAKSSDDRYVEKVEALHINKTTTQLLS